MTKEEAKEVLQEQIDKYGQEYDAEGIEALEIAINVLEQQTCDDCVSREDAINVAIDAVDDWDGGCNTNRATMISNAIKMLPSVTPSIPDVENDFNLGYNCGYAEAMCDIGGEE